MKKSSPTMFGDKRNVILKTWLIRASDGQPMSIDLASEGWNKFAIQSVGRRKAL
jgi:hypothetical protein